MIGSTLSHFAMQTPAKIAVQTAQEAFTYQDFYEQVQSIQQLLAAQIGGTAKRIALFLGNEPAFLTSFFAVAGLGWAAIPIDPKWSRHELALVLAECRPDAALYSPSFAHMVPAHIPAYLPTGQADAPIQLSREEDAIFYIGYTSGSTGRPKGFMRHHRSWLESFRGAEDAFSLSPEDHVYAPGPLCHSLSLFAAVHALQLGATVYIQETFSAAQAVQVLDTAPVNVIYAVPTMLYALGLAYGGRCNTRLQTILCSGAKWPADQKELVKQVFPAARRFEFYGASELSFLTYQDEAGYAEQPASVGKPFPGVELLILREDGTVADTGEIGTVFVKSSLVFSGYVHGTEDVFHGDLATVGDLGCRDAAGYLTLVGRAKNKIISGGLNVYPEEIEQVLRTAPGVEEAAVIGVADDYWGEMLVAAIQGTCDAPFLKQLCRAQLSSYKCPRLFVQVEAFPLTSSGKIARKAAAGMIEAELRKGVHL